MMNKRPRKRRKQNVLIPALIVGALCIAFPLMNPSSADENSNSNTKSTKLYLDQEKNASESSQNNTGTSAELSEQTQSPEVAIHIPFKLTSAAPVFRSPRADASIVAHLNRDDEIMLAGTIYGQMAKARLSDGQVGYIDKAILSEDVLSKLITEKITAVNPRQVFNIFTENSNLSLDEKFEFLKKTYQDKKYFNTSHVNASGLSGDWAISIITDIPCVHSENGYRYCQSYLGLTSQLFDGKENIQCLAFASAISDFLFGKDKPITKLANFEELAVGDHIRMIDSQHSVIVTELLEESVAVVECNQDYQSCQISWGRVLKKTEVEKEKVMYLSRRDGSVE